MNSIRLLNPVVLLIFAAGAPVPALSQSMQPLRQHTATVAQVSPSEIKVVAIGRIKGSGGERLAEDLSQALIESGQFRVVDREHTQRILREYRLGSSGLLTPEESRRLGQFLGADAYIMGNVTAHRTERFTSSLLGTPEARAIVELHIEIIDLRTAEVIASRRASRTVSSETDVAGQVADRFAARIRGDRMRRRTPDLGSLLAQARRRVVLDVANAVPQ
ncbi:MAG TPA: CsgG/HfaB family protein [Longimicrobiaceae bacterium]|nr:CsgG/HfaB family protein [Longimicrobiaceae bacterium]